MRTPAAIAEPMTPATFGPMACISRKLRGILLLAHDLGDTRRHRDGGNAGGTDQRVDLLLQEQVHELGEQNAARSAEAEGHDAHRT